MDTVCSVNAYSDGSKQLYDEIAAKLHEIDAEFSKTNFSSQIALINQNAGTAPVAVNREVLYVIREALYFSEITDGAFDPTIGPVVDLWGINTDHARVPSQSELNTALKLVDWHSVLIDGKTFDSGKIYRNPVPAAERDSQTVSQNKKNTAADLPSDIVYPNNTIFPKQVREPAGYISLAKKSMELDLGGIVKGFAADEITDILASHAIKSAIINLGGNIFAYGEKPDKSLWNIGVKNPEQPNADPLLILCLPGSTVVTSGIYERYFIQDGKQYHHIIDPKTGYPVDNQIASTTIICSSSITADALSTAVFVSGIKKGMQLVKKISSKEEAGTLPVFDEQFNRKNAAYKGIDVVYILKDGKIISSENIKDKIIK